MLEEKRIKVRMIGGYTPEKYKVFGGAIATSLAIDLAFKDDKEIDFKRFASDTDRDIDKLKEFIKDADIVHLDENVHIAAYFCKNNLKVDVLGPTLRSPIKVYYTNTEKTEYWECPYDADWYYSKRIIRLNHNEEKDKTLKQEYKGKGYSDKVDIILHAVNTDELLPSDKPKKYVLWAGDKYRYAKNFSFFEEVMKLTTLPDGYEFKVMSQYDVKDYWNVLDETAILVNTSFYESFCCAMYEAQSKGVPTIYPKNLHGERIHEDSMLQVEYTPQAFSQAIIGLLEDKPRLKQLGEYNRKYAVDFCSPKAMRDSIVEVYKDIYNKGSKE